MVYLLKHICFTFGFFLLLWLSGKTILDVLIKKLNLNITREFSAQFLIGTGFWIGIVFILCVLGIFNRTTVLILAAITGAAVLTVNSKSLLKIRDFQLLSPRKNMADILCSIGLTAVMLPLLIVSLLPELSWDANTYHLTIPKLYLQDGGFKAIAFNVYSNWPLNGELLFGSAMAIADFVAAKSVQWLFACATIIAMWSFCKNTAESWAGWLAAVFFLFNHEVLAEIPLAYVDIIHAFYMTTAFIFMHQAVQTPQNRTSLFLSGLSCGLMAGIKITAVIWSLPVALIFLVHLVHGSITLKRIKPFALLFCIPILILWTPWLIKSAVFTSNPVYPLLFGTFGGPDWSVECGTRFMEWQKSIGMGRGFLDYLLLPLRVIIKGGPGYSSFDGSINSSWIVLIPLMAAGAIKHKVCLHALLVSAGYFILWALASQQIRFLLPILPVAAMGSAIGIWSILTGLNLKTHAQVIVKSGIAVFCFGGLLFSSHERIMDGSNVVQHIIKTPEHELLQEAVHPIFKKINSSLPEHARILFINTNQGFFCDRDYIADSFFEASQIVSWLKDSRTQAEIIVKLRQKQISHILYWNVSWWKIDFPKPFLELLRDQKLVKLISVEGKKPYYLFEIVDEN